MTSKEKCIIKTSNILFPDRWELLGLLVVSSKTVDPAFNKNQPEFGVLVLPVPLQMLPDSHSLLDEVIQILWNFRSKAY